MPLNGDSTNNRKELQVSKSQSYEDLLFYNHEAGKVLSNQKLPAREVALKLGISVERARRYRKRFLKENKIPIENRGRQISVQANVKQYMQDPKQFDQMCEELLYGEVSVRETQEKYGLDGGVSVQTMYNLRNAVGIEQGDLPRKKRVAPARTAIRSLPEETLARIEDLMSRRNRGGYSWPDLIIEAGLDMSVSSFRRYMTELIKEREEIRAVYEDEDDL